MAHRGWDVTVMKDESTCPADAQLRALLDNRLKGHEGDNLLRHVDGCPHCQQRMEQLDDVCSALPEVASINGVEGRSVPRPADSMDYGPAFHRAFALLYAGPNQGAACAQQVEQPSLDRLLGKYADRSNPGRLGPYELQAVVGRGGMGIVFRVRDTV